MSADHISVADGKYTVVIDGGKLAALRHGEPWKDLCGDNLVYWLAVELKAARERVAELEKKRVQLTIEQLNALPEVGGTHWPMGYRPAILKSIRAVERAHGITDEAP